jgi:uncharacterized protein
MSSATTMPGATPTNPATPRATAAPRGRTQRLVRQLHLWIGAWGAIAAILYGFTGLVMNHRFGEAAWPQGDATESSRVLLTLPSPAPLAAGDFKAWLLAEHGLDAQVVRKAPSGPARLQGKAIEQPEKWTFAGGSARASWTLDYVAGNTVVEVKRSQHSPLAAFNRLHKGYGSWPWRLLADSFAIGMVLLGLSGLWMWARGRSARQLLLSVGGASAVVLGLVLAAAFAG